MRAPATLHTADPIPILIIRLPHPSHSRTQYNPFGDLSTLAPEPAARRIMPPGNRGSIIAVSYPARAFGVKRWARRARTRGPCVACVFVCVCVCLCVWCVCVCVGVCDCKGGQAV